VSSQGGRHILNIGKCLALFSGNESGKFNNNENKRTSLTSIIY